MHKPFLKQNAEIPQEEIFLTNPVQQTEGNEKMVYTEACFSMQAAEIYHRYLSLDNGQDGASRNIS